MGTPVRRRASVRAPIRRAPRRSRVWARRYVTMAPPAGTGTAVDLLADWKAAWGIQANQPGITVGGIMLDIGQVQTNARASSTDGAFVGIGVFDESNPAEVDRPNDPLTGMHSNWMWYQWLPVPGGTAGSTVSTFSAQAGPIRIRSKRKMQEINERLWLVVQPIGLTVVDYTFMSSVLLLQP